jgi:hypothetical protein
LVSMAALLVAGPARAECLGSCADALAGALIAIVVYGILGLVILVMLIRAKWRRAGLWVLGVSVLVAIGVPLLSQAWVAWKLRSTEGREIAGALPDLGTKMTLMIAESVEACYYDPCALFVQARGEQGTIALPADALRQVDPGTPIDLAALPLELWQPALDGPNTPRARPLTAEEREAAAAEIDYLVVFRKSWFTEDHGPIEQALMQRPGLEGLRATERANIVMGPVEGGKLDLARMKLDLLDLRLSDRALALILAPYNTQEAGNGVAGRPELEAQLCGEPAQATGWDCAYALD